MFGMICWVIHHGVPFDIAHALYEHELLAYTIMFSKFENGNLEWNWDSMSFVERR